MVEDTGFDFQEKKKEERRGERKEGGSDLFNTIELLNKLEQTEC